MKVVTNRHEKYQALTVDKLVACGNTTLTEWAFAQCLHHASQPGSHLHTSRIKACGAQTLSFSNYLTCIRWSSQNAGLDAVVITYCGKKAVTGASFQSCMQARLRE